MVGKIAKARAKVKKYVEDADLHEQNELEKYAENKQKEDFVKNKEGGRIPTDKLESEIKRAESAEEVEKKLAVENKLRELPKELLNKYEIKISTSDIQRRLGSKDLNSTCQKILLAASGSTETNADYSKENAIHNLGELPKLISDAFLLAKTDPDFQPTDLSVRPKEAIAKIRIARKIGIIPNIII